jgi:hypothetical protein
MAGAALDHSSGSQNLGGEQRGRRACAAADHVGDESATKHTDGYISGLHPSRSRVSRCLPSLRAPLQQGTSLPQGTRSRVRDGGAASRRSFPNRPDCSILAPTPEVQPHPQPCSGCCTALPSSACSTMWPPP